jgi:hypothetical protein
MLISAITTMGSRCGCILLSDPAPGCKRDSVQTTPSAINMSSEVSETATAFRASPLVGSLNLGQSCLLTKHMAWLPKKASSNTLLSNRATHGHPLKGRYLPTLPMPCAARRSPPNPPSPSPQKRMQAPTYYLPIWQEYAYGCRLK